MGETNVQTARRILAAWLRRDVEGALEFFHEDLEWRPALTAGGPEGVVHRGHAGMRRWFVEADEVWSALTVSDAEFRDAGEGRVLELGRFKAVGRESGVPIDQPQALLFEFEQGKVIRVRGFQSHEEALEATVLS